jgi:hypothetical protein
VSRHIDWIQGRPLSNFSMIMAWLETQPSFMLVLPRSSPLSCFFQKKMEFRYKEVHPVVGQLDQLTRRTRTKPPIYQVERDELTNPNTSLRPTYLLHPRLNERRWRRVRRIALLLWTATNQNARSSRLQASCLSATSLSHINSAQPTSMKTLATRSM